MKTLFSTIKEKFAKLKDAARKKFHDVGNWLRQHWNEVITFGPILIAGLSTFIRVGGKRLNLRKEENLKNLYCYDRSLGHYWKLRRPLSNNEWLMIEDRRKKGERLGDILSSMKVLK